MTETEAIRQNYELGVMAGEAREQQRIIKLLEAEMNRLQGWTDYPAINALMTIRGALSKEKNGNLR